jgi:hypothetical protein
MTTGYIYAKTLVSVPLAAAFVGIACFGIGFYSVFSISETHNRDLNFLEE